MISPKISNNDVFDHDVCVIGSGPVGLAFAIEAARTGLSVLILESGLNGVNARQQSLSDAHVVDPSRHDDMSIAVARRFGGTSNLWGARCLPFDPIDFSPRPGLVDACWPIGWDDFAPFLGAACQLTQSGGPIYRAGVPGVEPGDDEFGFQALERWSNIQQTHIAHRATLAESTRIDVRLGVTVTGLEFGETGAVRAIRAVTLDDRQVAIPTQRVVIAAGGLESTRLLLAADRQSPGRFGGAGGPLGRYYMAHVTGEIADIVFADGKLDRAFDFWVDAKGSYVRRRFTPSQPTQLRERILNIALWPVVPHISDAGHGSAILSSVYLALAYGPVGRRLVAEAIRKRHIPPAPREIGAHLANIVTDATTAMTFAYDFIRRRYFSTQRLPGFFVHSRSRRYGLFYQSEQLPRPDSRVRLMKHTDHTGVPKLEIDLRFCDSDVDSVLRTHKLFAEWLKRNGFGRLEWRSSEKELHSYAMSQACHGTHQIGTARMADSAKRGVVDRDLRTFGSPNLYVASTAVLPTSGQANPTLTAVALAVRLAQHLGLENTRQTMRTTPT